MKASVIVTVADEPRERLQRMIDRLAAQTLGPLEVVIAAPTRDRPSLEAVRAHGAVAEIRIVDNPTGQRCPGLNRAAREATSPIVHRVDARSLLAPDHVARCQARLEADASVGVVGGRQSSVDTGGGIVGRGLARALANPWVTGGAAYRRSGAAGEVDTVYLGSFRRSDLLAVGGYDETLDSNEDFDLCQRYIAAGARVWLEADLVVGYEGRHSFAAVWRQYEAFGRGKVRYWRSRRTRPNARQIVGLAAPLAGVVGLLLAARRDAAVAYVAAGVAGVAALDQIGVGGRPPIGERAVAWVTSVLVPAAWAVGAYREFFEER